MLEEYETCNHKKAKKKKITAKALKSCEKAKKNDEG